MHELILFVAVLSTTPHQIYKGRMKLSNAVIVATALLAIPSTQAAQCEHQRLVDILAPSGAQMGNALSVSGNRLIVGEWKVDIDLIGGAVGRAFTYELIGNSWVLKDTLQASDASDSDHFGNSISVSGECAIIAAYDDKDLGDNSGSAYFFDYVAGNWIEVQKVHASDGGPQDRFGTRVDISGTIAVVGAPNLGNGPDNAGSAYVFERVAGVWQETAILKPSHIDDRQRFGLDVAVHGQRIVVGAPHDDSLGEWAGAAYVFEKIAATWTQTAQLVADDAESYDEFGTSVDIHDDRVLVGGYIFESLPFGWALVGRLKPGKANLLPVALHGDTAILGTTVYRKTVGGWLKDSTLFASLNNANSIDPKFPIPDFGYSIALDESFAAIGSPFEPAADFFTKNVGAAYTFNLDELDDTMVGCPDVLFVGDGGVQTMILRAPAHPDSFYLVMGSATGTSPGIPFGNVTIPLNPDAYFNLTLTKANNPPPLLNTFGLMDGDGLALAYFVLPTGTDPSLAGLTLNHAYMLFDINTLEAFYSSDPIALSLGL